MPHTFRILAAGVLLALDLVLPSVAMATDARTAIHLCERNPDCSYWINESGTVDLVVGESLVLCPLRGECECICGRQSGKRTSLQSAVEGAIAGRGSLKAQ